jgi:glycerophosphoryl diester phosphodiesterase
MTHAPEIIAHRGANREAPENTLAAFEKALDIGVNGIELDVQFSRDGVPLVHHDPAIAGQPIIGMSVAEVQSLKPVPALADVIALVNGRCKLYVEVKAKEATMAVIELLAPHADWCAIHSFDHRIPGVASTFEEIPAGILLVSYLVDVVHAMDAAGARDVWQQADFIDAALVYAVHKAQGRVIAWTVNDPERARQLVDLGVDGICTDIPREIMDATGRRAG